MPIAMAKHRGDMTPVNLPHPLVRLLIKYGLFWIPTEKAGRLEAKFIRGELYIISNLKKYKDKNGR